MDDKKKIGQFLGAAPDDLRKDIGGIEFVDLNLTDPEYFRTGLLKIRRAAGLLGTVESYQLALEQQQEKTAAALSKTQLVHHVLHMCTTRYSDASTTAVEDDDCGAGSGRGQQSGPGG